MQIMASLQNGTAFFASTSLIGSAARWRLLRATNDALAVLRELPVDLTPSPALWEIKCVGLILIFIYAFQIAWSYRLFNYVAILLGAMPPASKRDTAKPKPCDAHDAAVRGGGAAFQPRQARVLLRARLSRLVRQPRVCWRPPRWS